MLSRRNLPFEILLPAILLAHPAAPQTPSTGALTGVVTDPSGIGIPAVAIQLARQDTGRMESATTNGEGRYSFALLLPGAYDLEARKAGFSILRNEGVVIRVTETLRLDLRLRIGATTDRVEVSSQPHMVRTDSSALGRVVNTTGVVGLPLVTRNFAQIAGLSPGVISSVFNAGELGLGGTAVSQINASNGGLYVHGARSYDNNWQMDGISVSDAQGSGYSSGGIPVPNPDAIREFNVQTGLYDAGFGRYAGANVSVVTKTGGNTFHGSLFEFLRNDVLNANDFFLNQTGQPRPTLKQNQFGFTVGGPLNRDKIFFFGSYQGTRQVNGLAAGQARTACSANISLPPLTDNRSPAALGALFGGMTGALGGVAISPDGSNIDSAALALLNFRLPNGNYLIPSPQVVEPSRSLSAQGFSTFSEPCHFSEDQGLVNFDYLAAPSSRLGGRFFIANDSSTVTFPGNGLNAAGNTPGFPSPTDSGFRVVSLGYTYAPSSRLLNEMRFGFIRSRFNTEAMTPFRWSDIGVAEGGMNGNNELPSLNILGSVSIASGFPRTITQNSYVFSNSLSGIFGAHSVRLGGALTRLQDNVTTHGLGTFLQFLSWPDFLIGLDSSGNNTGTFSNVFASIDAFGLVERDYRAWEAFAYAQDDYRISRSLTLNAGLRYERLGQLGDELGRSSSFDFGATDSNPPPGGSLAGYIVASNFPGTPPQGVRRANNTSGNDGAGEDTFAPRLGVAWQPPLGRNRLVVRGGYGAYYSRPTGQAAFQGIYGAPFSRFRINVGTANSEATFQAPFPQPFPTPEDFPDFPPYGPGTSTTIYTVAPGFRPALVHQYSFNVQEEFHKDWLLEIGYIGTRGNHLVRQRSLNQALHASPDNPVRGETADTIANIPLRVPVPGVPAASFIQMESDGDSWYDGLEVSLTRRLTHGLQFLASYTFSKTLDTDGADINSTSAGNALTLGDQNSPGQRRGRASFDRTHRLVVSSTWEIPSPRSGLQRILLGSWSLSGVAILQSGSALTIAHTNATNVFGISQDRAQLVNGCTNSQLLVRGPIGSKLNGYFNESCFTEPSIVGADGIGTAFGNSGTGIVNGPAQANLDFALSKALLLDWPREESRLEFRVEFFNAFNHPQFSNPDATFGSPTFGVISSTAVNPRVGQFALKFIF